MSLNGSSDNKSFETIELLPIQEMLTDFSEPTSIIEPSNIKMPSVETQISQTPISIDSVLGASDVVVPLEKENKSSDTKKSSNTWAAVREHSNTNATDIDNTSYNQAPPKPTINYDFNRFFRANVEMEKERQETRKRRLFVTWYVIITCLVLLMVGSTIMKLYARISQNRDQNRVTVETYPDGGTREYTDFEDMLTSANPDYQVLLLEDIKYSNQACEILPELIIHVDKNIRTLYFRIMPYKDNVVPIVTVTAYDINGKQIAENLQSLYAVKGYDIGILPITLRVPADKQGVSYTVKCNSGTIVAPDTQREIIDAREEDGHIYVTAYGKYSLENNVYIILYKDGALVDVLSAIPSGTYTGKYRKAEADFDVSQIDFDSFEVYG